MSTFTLDRTVAELVLEKPSRSRFFETMGIDYCCGGKKTLQEVCERKQLDPANLLKLLEADDLIVLDEATERISEMSLGELVVNIIERHHEYLRQELPRLQAMLSKVVRVHGESEPRLHQMLSIFQAFAVELGTHMMKEENILFPVIAQMEAVRRIPQSCFGTIANPIRQMEFEHDGAGDALARLRDLSDGFRPPEWACNTYRAVLDGLHDIEQNMHVHVHKENNVLFPKALELEEELLAVAP